MKQNTPIASNTANIMGTCAEYGHVPKGSLPHWTVAGSRTIRDEKSRMANNRRNERRVEKGLKPRRDRGRRPEVTHTETRDGREIKVCESPDTYSLCEVKVGGYPNRPQRLEFAEPTAREQGWSDPLENMGQPMTHEDLLEEYRLRNKRNAKPRKSKLGSRKVTHEASALRREETLSREKKRERFHVIREHEKARGVTSEVDSGPLVTAAVVESIL